MKTVAAIVVAYLLLAIFATAHCETATKKHPKRSAPQNGASFLGVQNPTQNVARVDSVLKLILDAFSPKNQGSWKNLLNYDNIKKDLLLLRRSLEWILEMGTAVERYMPDPYVSDDYFGFFDFFFPEFYVPVDDGVSDLKENDRQKARITLKEPQNQNGYYFMNPQENIIDVRLG